MFPQIAVQPNVNEPWTVRIGYQYSHTVELLAAGEDKEALAGFPSLLILFLMFVDELAHQIQHAVGRPGLLPQIGCGVAAPGQWDGRVAGAAELHPV